MRGTGVVLLCMVVLSGSVMAQEQGLQPYVVETLAYNPAGTQIAVAGGPLGCDPDAEVAGYYAIYILDATTFQVITSFGDHICTVNSLDWSPDGTKIVTSNDEGTARVWDVATGQEIVRYEESGYGVTSLSGALWNPVDSRVLISSGSGAIVWDSVTGMALYRVPQNPMSFYNDVEWDSTGTLLGLPSIDGIIEVWDTGTITQPQNQLVNEFNIGLETIDIEWSPDSSRIAASTGTDILILNAATGQLLQTLQGATEIVLSMDWSPHGHQLATGASDSIVRIWDVETGQQVTTYTAAGPIYAINWNSDGSSLVFSGIGADPNGDLVQHVTVIVIAPSPTPAGG